MKRIVVAVAMFVATQAQTQSLSPDPVKGQLYQSGADWKVGDFVIEPRTKRLTRLYTTVRLNSYIPDIYSGTGFQVMGLSGPTMTLTGVRIGGYKGWMVGGTTMFWLVGPDHNSKFLVEATFTETARNPDPDNPGTGRLMFMGLLTVRKGTGIYENVTGTGSWGGSCGYVGETVGFVDSFSFLATSREIRVMFSCSFNKSANIQSANRPIRPIMTSVIPTISPLSVFPPPPTMLDIGELGEMPILDPDEEGGEEEVEEVALGDE